LKLGDYWTQGLEADLQKIASEKPIGYLPTSRGKDAYLSLPEASETDGE
jgi:hypothetical protein